MSKMKTCMPVFAALVLLLPAATCKPLQLPPPVNHVNCIGENGVKPIYIYNSPYTILPNESLCCPYEPFHPNGDSICIDEDRVEAHCKLEGRGVTSEPCIYCRTCAKLAGETCRGPQLIHGKCDEGLECVGTEPDDTMIGVCRKTGGTEVKAVGEVCGGRLDSLGVCDSGSECTEVQGNGSVCVRQEKTQNFNKPCGGAYGSEGRCKRTLRCTANEDEFLKGENITGTCFKSDRKVCFKDCSEEPHGPGHWLCASNGVWYPNNCYRKQVNCQYESQRHPDWVEKTKESHIPDTCGEEPTVPPAPAVIATSDQAEGNTEEEATPTNEETTPM